MEVEIRMAVDSSPKYKAAGMDGVTTEAIKSCGETSIKWLKLIFQKAWEERCIPKDCQRVNSPHMEKERMQKRRELI